MLYHSFPQRRDNQQTDDKDIEILRSILKYGLLLVPNIIEYPGKTDEKGKEKSDVFKLLQCRFCLTAIDDTKKLKEHADVYGDFHLEFTDENAYGIGAMPVIHIPKSPYTVKDEPTSLWHLASSFIHLLGDLKTIAYMLEYLDKATIKFAHEKEIIINSETGLAKRVSIAQLRDTLELIFEGTIDTHDEKKRNKEFEKIQGTIQGLCSLLYFTDYLKENGEYEYLYHFWVREWRIVQGMSINGKKQDRELTQKEQETIKAIDPHFFGRKLDFQNNGTKPCIIDLCRLLPSINDKPIQNFINQIHVPYDRYERTLEILGKDKFLIKKIVPYDKEKGIPNKYKRR
ncbi:MAG: hypothetical protein FWF38_03200 [Spirochaetaceae bacterium]|nr:hypothetical protein [Spirochaetaceae bacterium]